MSNNLTEVEKTNYDSQISYLKENLDQQITEKNN